MQPTHLTHLTDEQFTDLLLGTSPASVQAHLKACPQCAEEAARVSGAIGSFQQQTRLWAERRAASQPALTSQRQPIFEWLHRPAAWTTAGLAIALTVGISVSVHKSHQQPMHGQQQAAVSQHPVVKQQISAATIKADNELLSAIDGELRADESSSMSAYGLIPSAHGSHSRAPKRVSNE
ncbi:MAG TPA: hypothetical protein VGN01_18905 [Acidobacteriaceae bacterium]|jgi:anti-sigma factor RsiW